MAENHFKCAVFDLDGVVTQSASIHSEAWKTMFDEYLKVWSAEKGVEFREFTNADYLKFVDGKPRYQGCKSFFESRGVELPFGDPSDGPDVISICGLGNKKNVLYTSILGEKGAEVFPTSVEFIRELKRRGIRVGVASSSANTKMVLQKAGLTDLFETRVCGIVSAEMSLKGKPNPDIFVVAAKALGFDPVDTMMVEDAIAGVQAGAAGKFGLVLGIAREIPAAELQQNGADLVVGDLGEITVDQVDEWFASGKNQKS